MASGLATECQRVCIKRPLKKQRLATGQASMARNDGKSFGELCESLVLLVDLLPGCKSSLNPAIFILRQNHMLRLDTSLDSNFSALLRLCHVSGISGLQSSIQKPSFGYVCRDWPASPVLPRHGKPLVVLEESVINADPHQPLQVALSQHTSWSLQVTQDASRMSELSVASSCLGRLRLRTITWQVGRSLTG